MSWDVEAAVHVFELQFAAGKQHVVGCPAVEVDEWPGDRIPFENRKRLSNCLVSGHVTV
ncbi:unnamed protein product [Gemmataceae bacterium]|nr:unnamed protein product [Gemmataceae bacterium]VTT98624.1 unnamed protein product [Gemmataceae bacterium]